MKMPNLTLVLAATALAAVATSTVQAEPVRLEALLSIKTESKLELADGSKRYLLATQREGPAAGSGPLAGATMLEWGVHEVTPGVGADGNGYLVFTLPSGELAYLKYRFRAVPVAGPDGKPQNRITGAWELVGSTGKLKGLQGAGTVLIKAVSAKERLWVLEGDLVQAPEQAQK